MSKGFHRGEARGLCVCQCVCGGETNNKEQVKIVCQSQVSFTKMYTTFFIWA